MKGVLMDSADIFLTLNNPNFIVKMKTFLKMNQFNVIGSSLTGSEALRKVRIFSPAFLIIDFKLPDINGLTISKILSEEKICSIILLVSPFEREGINQSEFDIRTICLEKPINKEVLLNTIRILTQSKLTIDKLEEELISLKEDLEMRKLIEKAKGILMKTSNISESEAYRKLQKKSMDSGISMRDISILIIDTFS